MDTKEIIKQKIRIKKELHKIKSRSSFVNFVTYTNHIYEVEWFHKLVCEYLDKLEKGEIKKLMIFIPPQHGKSELSSRRFPAYSLGRNPRLKIAIGSYSPDLATSFNRAIQQVMTDEKYREVFPETKLNEKNVSTASKNGELRNSTIFETIGYKGFVKTVGVGTGLTGTPVDLGIIDDPFKDRTTANSPTIRQNVWDWYNDVFCTRLHNDSRQLLLFTRWHEDDLAGRLLDPLNEHYNEDEAKEWTVIALPALKEATKPLECALDIDDPREIDEALWENKHSAEKYKRRRQTNPTGFASLDQQRPAPLEGSKLLREWFVTKKPSELPFNLNDVKADFFIDGAFTEQTQNDETGLGSFYYHKQTNTLYVLNVSGVRKELYELLPYFKQYVLLNQYKSSSNVFIELKASGHPLKSMLSKPEYGGFNCRAVPSKVVGLGKWNRVENAEPFLASGKVVLVEGSWNKAFIDQCCGFPNLVHDDLVDILCYGVHHYFIKSDAGGGVSYED
jgi:predicted phage terminase large subunit-like protein